MKFRGGYNIRLQGRPAGRVELLPEPEILHLPLRSRRFSFSEIRVEEGQRVLPGHVLARDPGNFLVPLLAPRAGTVRLSTTENHVTLEDVAKVAERPYEPEEDLPHILENMGSVGMKRNKLLMLGAWQFLEDAHTGALPDPFGTPRAVIVSTLRLEPFLARGDVQLHQRLSHFTRGLEHLQSLLEYQPIYLVLPDIESDFARHVRETLRGYAWVKLVRIPLKYAYDNFTVLARALGLKTQTDQPVWAMSTAGVLALDRALTLARPSAVRIVAIGGPAVKKPVHVKAMPGYPLGQLLEARVVPGPTRTINGGVLTGDTVASEQVGLDCECEGLTVLSGQTEEEFLGWIRPGLDRRSYSKCFLSSLRRPFAEKLRTAVRGEHRPCISCNFCEEVCPVSIMPHLIHRYLYQDAIEDAERFGVELCVACGLCSFVCPSKINLRKEFLTAQETIRTELHEQEVRS